jgi:catalase
MNFLHRDEEVNYFPSRFDPVRNAERTPTNSMPFSGKRERAVIVKENNFQQPGERFRSFDAARQERFIGRICGVIGDARATPEIRRIWVRERERGGEKKEGRRFGRRKKRKNPKTKDEEKLTLLFLGIFKKKQVGYLTQCDAGLGRRVAQKLQSMGAA